MSTSFCYNKTIKSKQQSTPKKWKAKKGKGGDFMEEKKLSVQWLQQVEEMSLAELNHQMAINQSVLHQTKALGNELLHLNRSGREVRKVGEILATCQAKKKHLTKLLRRKTLQESGEKEQRSLA